MAIDVVYIDDEGELCEIFSDLFSSDEIRIKTFTDPDAGIKFVKQNPPDLVFIDFRLPSTTGDKVALALDSKIPKYLITGDLSLEVNDSFKSVFSKPYNENDILKTLQKYLSLKK